MAALISIHLWAITEAVKTALRAVINLQILTIRVTAAQAITALTAVTAGIVTTVLRMWAYLTDITEAAKVALLVLMPPLTLTIQVAAVLLTAALTAVTADIVGTVLLM